MLETTVTWTLRGRLISVWLGALFLLAAIPGNAGAEPRLLSLDSIAPAVIVQGTETELTLSGKFDQDVDQLVFSHPGIQAVLLSGEPLPGDDQPTQRFGQFRVTVASDVPPGVYEVHAAGRFGVSNPRLLTVLPNHCSVHQAVPLASDATNKNARGNRGNAQGENQSASPYALELNSVFTGYVSPTSWQSFRIPKSDQVRYIVCASISIDSPLLPRIRVRNQAGNTVRSARWRDRAPILIGLPKGFEGELQIADEMFRGGVAFTYALGCFDTLSHPLPYAEQFYPVASVNRFIANSASHQAPPTENEDELEAHYEIVDLRNLDASASDLTSINPPAEILLDVTSGQKIMWTQPPGVTNEVEYFSAAMGHSTDARISLFKNIDEKGGGGELVGTYEDSPALGSNGITFTPFDPRFTVATPAESEPTRYRIDIDDLQSRSQIYDAENNPIRLRIGPPSPRFQCVAHWAPWTNAPTTAGLTGSFLPANGVAAIHVIASRLGGYAGKIEIGVEGLPPGLTATRGIIQPNQTETIVFIQSSAEGQDWTGRIHLNATGELPHQTDSQPDSDAPPQSKLQKVHVASIHIPATPERGLPQSRLATDLWVRAVKQETAPILISSSAPTYQVHAGEKLQIALKAERSSEGAAKCLLRPKYLAPGMSMPEFELPAEANDAVANDAVAELTTTSECMPGEYVLCFQGEMVWKQAGPTESHSRHVAYRDRLKVKLEKAESDAEKSELENLIAQADRQLEALSGAMTATDRTVQFYTSPVIVTVLAPNTP